MKLVDYAYEDSSKENIKDWVKNVDKLHSTVWRMQTF